MVLLGIESSCDETAASIVENGRFILSNTIVSSLKDHSLFGGIVPEIASRRQLEYIQAVVNKSLKTARLSLQDIDGIAVTTKPGLIGSLLVGISFARALSVVLEKPLIEVNHVHAHLYANFLTGKRTIKNSRTKPCTPKLPAIGLVVSGGHTNLYHLKNFSNFKLIGQTLDDAAGEAFDKVAHILGLGYPGGPAIDRLSKGENKSDLRFTCAPLPGTLNFSFSGIKTAVLYHHRDNNNKKDFSTKNTAVAFQQSIISNLVKKCTLACRKLKIKTLLVGGGVAANSLLRKKLLEASHTHGIKTFFPPMSLCLDNAAMIAGLGYHQLKKGQA